MATNELDYQYGLAVSIPLSLANPAASTANVLLAPQGASGYVVPTGYKFHPMLIQANSNADLSAGTLTFQATADGTVLTNGPSAVLSDTVQKAAGVARPGASPIAAGAVVGIKATGDASYAPVTADVDAILTGVLLPA